MRPSRGALALVALAACAAPTPPEQIAGASRAAARAERRAYDGAPPVMPHRDFSRACESCHDGQGVAVPGLGFAPASPHGATAGMRAARCEQCHAARVTSGEFRVSRFEGLRRPTGPAAVAFPGAPPVMPHPLQMRESCVSCHSRPGARPEILTSHPERTRCRQCHVEQRTSGAFGVSG